MQTIIKQMLQKHKAVNTDQQINALREVLQEVILYCLSKTDFFKRAAFYGGTALRICHKLDRFSEDLDFSLIKPNKSFNLYKYALDVIKFLKSFGLNATCPPNMEKSVQTNTVTTYIEFNMKDLMKQYFYPNLNKKIPIDRDRKLSIKFEVDTNPPENARYEHIMLQKPQIYTINKYDVPSMFAAKIDCIVCRSWKNRGMKGRDLYDYEFYINNGYEFNLDHLKSRWLQRNLIEKTSKFDLKIVIGKLNNKFKEIDYDQAKNDVSDFLDDIDPLKLWSLEHFTNITKSLKAKKY